MAGYQSHKLMVMVRFHPALILNDSCSNFLHAFEAKKRVVNCLCRIAVSSLGFHPRNQGSTPCRGAKLNLIMGPWLECGKGRCFASITIEGSTPFGSTIQAADYSRETTLARMLYFNEANGISCEIFGVLTAILLNSLKMQ